MNTLQQEINNARLHKNLITFSYAPSEIKGNGKRYSMSSNFTLEELGCHCSRCSSAERVHFIFHYRLLEVLQLLRNHLGFPVYPNSGYRCIVHPYTIKNPLSNHHKGLAVDISLNGWTILKLIKAVLFLGSLGIENIGIDLKKEFMHIALSSEYGNNRIGVYDYHNSITLKNIKGLL